MSRKIDFTVPSEYSGKKLSQFIRGYVGMSYSLYATLRHTEGAVTRNGLTVRSIDRINAGDIITVEFPRTDCDILPVETKLDIIFEDEDVLVLNKSGFIAMHPSHGHRDDTLANGVVYYLESKGFDGSFRAVGRLDKGTSGVVVCALNTYAASKLSGTVSKTYIAIADGIITNSGTVDVPIIRPDPDKTLRACSQNGEKAITHYEVLATGCGKTLLKLHLETGRTHQIRVHMAHLNAPLVGDSLYGNDNENIGRHLLHCISCEFCHPLTDNRMSFKASLPEEFKEKIKSYFGKSIAFD